MPVTAFHTKGAPHVIWSRTGIRSLRNHNCYDDDIENFRKEFGKDATGRNLIYVDTPTEQVKAEIAKLRKIFGNSKADAGIRNIADRPFSISIGYVSALRGEDISETAVRADTMMMEEKRKYYQINGIDGRRASR
ncbi:MAG: hypothetical protein MJ128_02085 [Mogibacterium sp.]|nr:hypothetical protein [Mogibacterium sp.]